MKQPGAGASMAQAAAFDVIVVGAGGSGLAAAARAAQSGARVLVLERRAQVGGTTWMAVGSISAARTQLQQRAGIDDDFGGFVEDMNAFTADLLAQDHAPLRRMLAEQAGITVDWLAQQGVAFAGPYEEPPHRIRRMHNTIPGPGAIVQRLLITCKRHGVSLRTGVTVSRLLMDAAGRVEGVEYLEQGQLCQAMARGGVVLASGDFSGSQAMRQAHLPEPAARASPINPDNQGDGFRLAQEAGAVLVHMDKIFGPQMRFERSQRPGLNDTLPSWPWLTRLGALFFMHAPGWMLQPLIKSLLIANMSPSEELFRQGAVLVDKQGRRLDTARPAVSVAMTQERAGYIVIPGAVADKFRAHPFYLSTAPGIAYAYLGDYERGRPDIVHRASSLPALAQALGMNVAELAQSTNAGSPQGPWLALGPVRAMLTTTEGAVRVDTSCRVLNANDQVIDGLYAVGCIGQGGLLLRGHGLHLAWAFTSGRVAGQDASCQVAQGAQ
jgi:fumarate reductase flavoprotein subunit